MEASDLEPAAILYIAYCQHTGWKSLATGQDLPQWENLRSEIQQAWRAVATRAKAYYEDET